MGEFSWLFVMGLLVTAGWLRGQLSRWPLHKMGRLGGKGNWTSRRLFDRAA